MQTDAIRVVPAAARLYSVEMSGLDYYTGHDPDTITLAEMLENEDFETYEAALFLDVGESVYVGGGAAPEWKITREA